MKNPFKKEQIASKPDTINNDQAQYSRRNILKIGAKIALGAWLTTNLPTDQTAEARVPGRLFNADFCPVPEQSPDKLSEKIDYIKLSGPNYPLPEKLDQHLEKDARARITGRKGWYNIGEYYDHLRYIYLHNGLDPQIANLLFVESQGRYTVASFAHAVGLYQFIKSTGKENGLVCRPDYDERYDPILSADASSRHLYNLYQGKYCQKNWSLAFAAYNGGPKSIATIHKQYPRLSIKEKWQKFIEHKFALARQEQRENRFRRPNQENSRYPFICDKVFRIIDSEFQGKVEQKPLKEFEMVNLNLQIKQKVINYQVQKNDTLSGIADVFKVSIEDLQEWNNLKNVHNLRIGQKIKIYRTSHKNISFQEISDKLSIDIKTLKELNPAFTRQFNKKPSEIMLFGNCNLRLPLGYGVKFNQAFRSELQGEEAKIQIFSKELHWPLARIDGKTPQETISPKPKKTKADQAYSQFQYPAIKNKTTLSKAINDLEAIMREYNAESEKGINDCEDSARAIEVIKQDIESLKRELFEAELEQQAIKANPQISQELNKVSQTSQIADEHLQIYFTNKTFEQLMITRTAYVNAIEYLNDAFTGNNGTISEQEYKKIRSYLIGQCVTLQKEFQNFAQKYFQAILMAISKGPEHIMPEELINNFETCAIRVIKLKEIIDTSDQYQSLNISFENPKKTCNNLRSYNDKIRLNAQAHVTEDDQTEYIETVFNEFEYTVPTGATLYSIANNFQISQKEIINANKALRYRQLHSGETIMIPRRHIRYIIQRNDTAFSIAQKYKININDLYNANPPTTREAGLYQYRNKMPIGKEIRIIQ